MHLVPGKQGRHSEGPIKVISAFTLAVIVTVITAVTRNGLAFIIGLTLMLMLA